MNWFQRTFPSKTSTDAVEREKIERLEKAEQELRELQVRGTRAIGLLSIRGKQNHWREAIEQMIQGAS